MADLTTADPVTVVLAWLKDHSAIATEFGGPNHVSGLAEAPWPHLCVLPGVSGDFGSLIWRATIEVILEVYADPAGTIGEEETRRLTMVAALAARDLTDRVVDVDDPVVCQVRPSGMLAASPLVNGQRRWTMGMSVTLHPAP